MRKRSKKTARIWLMIGLVSLAAAILLYLFAPDGSQVNEAMIKNGQTQGMSAQEAAQQFSSNNQYELIFKMISYALGGFGTAVMLASIVTLSKK